MPTGEGPRWSRPTDDLYRSIRPILATSGGRLVALSSAWAKVGRFYEAAAVKGGRDALLSAHHRRGYTLTGMREKATKDRPR